MSLIRSAFLLFVVFAAVSCNSIVPGKNNNDELKNYTEKTIRAQESISDFRISMAEAQMNAIAWLHTPGENAQKADLKNFVDVTYPALKTELLQLEKDSAFPDGCDIRTLMDSTDVLIGYYSELMSTLTTVESYENPTMVFFVYPWFDADGDCVITYNRIKSMSQVIEDLLREWGEQQLSAQMH